MNVQKGTIHSIEGGNRAKCVPVNDPGIVTQPLVIPFYWRYDMGNVQVGEEVYYLEDEAMGGYIIGRCDGEWQHAIRGDVSIEGGVTATGDVVGQGKSLATHTHTDSQSGKTSPPN